MQAVGTNYGRANLMFWADREQTCAPLCTTAAIADRERLHLVVHQKARRGSQKRDLIVVHRGGGAGQSHDGEAVVVTLPVIAELSLNIPGGQGRAAVSLQAGGIAIRLLVGEDGHR